VTGKDFRGHVLRLYEKHTGKVPTARAAFEWFGSVISTHQRTVWNWARKENVPLVAALMCSLLDKLPPDSPQLKAILSRTKSWSKPKETVN